jgi:hypothetical protein
MIFSAGTTFIFSSWICKADDNGKLQSHFMEIPMLQAPPAISTTALDQLAKKFSHLSIFDLTQTREASMNQDSHLDTSDLSGLETPSEVHVEEPSRLPLGLKNLASIYQDTICYLMQLEQAISLMGLQKGLVLSITPEGGIVHWSDARPNTSPSDPSCLVGMVELLPYQDGSTLPADDDHGSMEILDSAMTAKSETHLAPRHSREVFMAGYPPQIPMP